MNRQEMLVAWVEGRYALGWRGHVAMWLLNPILNEMLCVENKLLKETTSH